MAARLHLRSEEQEPLLAAHSRRSYPQGTAASSSHIHLPLDGQHSLTLSASSFPSGGSSSSYGAKDSLSSSRSLRIQVLLAIMVVIPMYMLASSAVTQLGPLSPRNIVIQSPQPDPLPIPLTQMTSSSSETSDPSFASILGPHISTNFPDPAVIYVDGTSYAFATNNRQPAPNHVNIQVATSTDNQTWMLVDGYDALPHLGAWETGAGVWAPDVVQLVSSTQTFRSVRH